MVRATVWDVARRADVSVATVSRVLNGTKRVSGASRQRVEAAIAELNYTPSSVAQSLRRSKSRVLGLVLPGLENPFFPLLIEQAARVAENAGYSVSIRLSRTPLATAVEMSKGQQVDGIVVVGNQGDPEPGEAVARSLVPLVAFDRLPGNVSLPLFQVANSDGAALVVEHLLQRRSGSVRLLHIAGPAGLDVSADRLAGVQRAVEAACAAGSSVELVVAAGDFSERSGFTIAQGLVGRPDQPDAVFAANDLMAIGAIRAAQAAGLFVGQDILVAGFDGLDLGAYISPSLTTYRQPIARISHQAVTHLIGLVEANSMTEASPPTVVRFDGELIVRDSTGGSNV